MNKAVLIHTLGNRDLQFHSNAAIPGKFARTYFDVNTEDDQYYVLKKGRQEGQATFREICVKIQRKLEDPDSQKLFEPAIYFPLLQAACTYILQDRPKIQQVTLYASLQSPAHHQDTDIVAEFAKAYLERHFPHQIQTVHIEYFNMSPLPNDQARMLSEFNESLERISQQGFSPIYLNNNQGLPQATAILNFLGLFQPYTYLQIGKDNYANTVFQSRKEEILEGLLKNRLQEQLQEANLPPDQSELILQFIQSLQFKK